MATQAEIQKTVKGLVMPIPAVFDGKGEPDLPMMEELTDWYLDTGVHGFFILGSQGQGPATCTLSRQSFQSYWLHFHSRYCRLSDGHDECAEGAPGSSPPGHTTGPERPTR